MATSRECTTIPAEFGPPITELRVSRGLTQAQVAGSLGNSHRCVCEIEAREPIFDRDYLFGLINLLEAELTLEEVKR